MTRWKFALTGAASVLLLLGIQMELDLVTALRNGTERHLRHYFGSPSGKQVSQVRSRPSVGGMRSQAWAAEAVKRDAAWQNLVHALTVEAMSYRGRVGIYLKDLNDSRTWAYHSNDLFPSASLIKIPIMAAVFQRVRQGPLSLNSKRTLRRREREGGSGTIKWQRDGARFTVRQLLVRMIAESDNTAMKMLINEVGMRYLQKQFQNFGLVYTGIYSEGLSLTGGRVRRENYTTAREMAEILEKIYRGKLVDRSASELMMELMKKNRMRRRLSQNLPIGWEIAHKTGLLRNACHDVGIVFTPQGDYVLAVLTGSNRSYDKAKSFLSRIGAATFRHYGGDGSMLASTTLSPKS